MHLHHDWRRILARAWSVRLAALLATLIIVIDPIVYVLLDLSAGWGIAVRIGFGALHGLLSLAVIWARIIKQKEFEDG